MVLRWPDWKGLLLGVSGLLFYLASAFGLLSWGHWVLPFVIPMSATAIVLVTTGLLGQIMAARRIALLEQDMLHIQQDLVAVREALVYRETAVETLEEDLESARARMSHAASKETASTRLAVELQQKITDAQAQEEATRRRMRNSNKRFAICRRQLSVPSTRQCGAGGDTAGMRAVGHHHQKPDHFGHVS